MRPWQHAKASARRGERDWRDDLPIHELVDITKRSLPDLRHRLVLHNGDFGPALIGRAFPGVPHAAEVAREHAMEDLRADVPLRAWLDLLDHRRLPRVRHLDPETLIAREQDRARLRDPDGPRSVVELLRLPFAFAPTHPARAWCVLGNAAGIGLVRRVLGPPRDEPGLDGRTVVFDPAHCAEAVLCHTMRRIPELREIADALVPRHREALASLREAG